MSSSNTVDPADRVETRSRRARRTSSSPLSFLNEFCTTAAESFQMPPLVALILTHILQTEVKSKMSTLKKRLQRELAFPDGSPSRRPIMGAWKTSHPGVPPPEQSLGTALSAAAPRATGSAA